MVDAIPKYTEEGVPPADTILKPGKLLTFDSGSLIKGIDLSRVYYSIRESGDRHVRESELVDLATGVVNLSNLIVVNRADTLVLTDKSARPIAHLLKSFWKELYPEFRMPDVKFINIGREAVLKQDQDYALKQLYHAHSKSMNRKVVIVADEKVHSGSSIKVAKGIIEKTFPELKKAIYVSVFRQTPPWFAVRRQLGVYDLPNLPYFKEGNLWGEILESSERPTYVAKTITGVMRRNPKYDRILRENIVYSPTVRQRQRVVNEFRAELSYLAKKIADSCKKVPFGSITPKTNLEQKAHLDEILNGGSR